MTSILCAVDILGLDPIEILIHMLNFVLLVVGMRFLLYKPVKKFMAKRDEDYKKAAEDHKKALEETTKLRAVCDNVVVEARTQAVLITEEAAAAAKLQAEEIIKKGNDEARSLVEKAKKDIADEQQKAKEALAGAATELAVEIAGKLLEREVSASDNDAAIDALVNDFKSGSTEE